MLILLDNNAPRGLARALTGHVVTEARERGWATFKNGDLLRVAEEAGFDVLVTAQTGTSRTLKDERLRLWFGPITLEACTQDVG